MMSKPIQTSVLILLLACSAQAGHMQNDAPAPAPQPATAIQEPTSAAQEPATQATTEDGTQGTFQSTLTQTALDLLVILPSLL